MAAYLNKLLQRLIFKPKYLAMPYINSHTETDKDVRIFYEDWGEGQPIVLIHGWPVSHEMWEYQAGALAGQGYRVISYDRRGFGKSDKPFSGYDYTNLAGDLKALIEELDLNNLILAGFSMGGGEVVRYCSKYGTGRVAKVILISSIAPYLLKTDTNPDGVPMEFFNEIAGQIKNDRPAFLSTFGKTFFGQSLLSHPVSQEILNWMHGLALIGSSIATIQCLHSFSQTDFRKEMAEIKVPSLILHGDADKIVPIKATSEQAATLIPGAIFKKYDGSPHGLFITDMEELTADMIQFIEKGNVEYNFEKNEAVVIPELNSPMWP
jgi:non-heme chloroperoxidase